ncbi:hypothetical protein ZOSMA_21G00330 [Zostera marina]|uniref:Uncharacterized protein n=1 Tax=Zostera marina TaxID=29655 RepID=A0A0K9PJQ0_ZOSMR|nr:hypothetical protein ZOSMA_21G00330 [Zostera marina]
MDGSSSTFPTPTLTPTKAEVDAEKIKKLKQLNNDLVKETVKTRKKIKLIQSQMIELCGDLDDSLVAGLDLSVSLAYLKMSMDEKKGVEFKERVELVKENKELQNKIFLWQTNHHGEKNGELWEQINVMKKEVEAVKEEMDEIKYLEFKNNHESKIMGLQEEIIRLSSRVAQIQMRRNGSEINDSKVYTKPIDISSDCIRKKVKTILTLYLRFLTTMRNIVIPKTIRICKKKVNCAMDLGPIVALKMDVLASTLRKNKLYKTGEERVVKMINHIQFVFKMLGDRNKINWGFTTSIVGVVVFMLIVVYAGKP